MPTSETYNVDCMEFMKGLPDKKRFVTKHGMSRTRLYRIYVGIKARCYRPSCATYKKYGAKGIRVCDEWMGEDGFINFAKWAKENGYNGTLTIDRLDSSGDYSPENCRWVTVKEQQNNKRTNRIVIYHGKKYTLTQLSEKIGIKKTTLKERLNNGWSIEDAVNRPVRLRTKGWRKSTCGADMTEELVKCRAE